MPDDGRGAALTEIPREECLALLRSVEVGRIAVSRACQGPLVVPVNYVIDGDAVVFRSDAGTKLASLGHRPVSFEVDLIDALRRTGWSVLVEGMAEVRVAALDPGPAVASWVPDAKPYWVRIVPRSVTGRRLRFADLPVDGRGYL